MIVILDYGVGNLGSIQNMILRAGGRAIISSDINLIASAKGFILPGVGAFDHGMKKLKSSGMLDILESRVIKHNVPILGVCLGMQMLFNNSEEGDIPGLGWIDGSVKKFKFERQDSLIKLKIPHMGWNIATPEVQQSLFKGFEDDARFYFVHSYHVVCNDKENVLATTQYGYDFTSSVYKNNIYGVQFHPEKSHRFGMKLFKNFMEICEC